QWTEFDEPTVHDDDTIRGRYGRCDRRSDSSACSNHGTCGSGVWSDTTYNQPHQPATDVVPSQNLLIQRTADLRLVNNSRPIWRAVPAMMPRAASSLAGIQFDPMAPFRDDQFRR